MKLCGYLLICALFVFFSCLNPATEDTISNPPGVTKSVGDLIITEVGFGYYSNCGLTIELYNPTAQDQNLGDFRIASSYAIQSAGSWPYNTDLKSFSLPRVNIPAGGYLVLKGNPYSDYYKSGGATVYVGNSSSGFPYSPSDNGALELKDTNGNTIHFVRWGSSSKVPSDLTYVYTGSAPAVVNDSGHIGYCIARNSSNLNTNSGTDWTSHAFMTQGAINDVESDTDADGDGIPDYAEVSGKTFAGLDYYTMGARTNQKDIFVHIDYMDNSSYAEAALQPTQNALNKVKAAFLAKNFYVHFDVGSLFGASLYNLSNTSHQVPYSKRTVFWTEKGATNVYKYKNTYMPVAKKSGFIYVLFANTLNDGGNSGMADIGGSTVLITLGSNEGAQTWTDIDNLDNFEASTLMHELGHALGLHHGGNVDYNFKPNYPSIMNYLYSFTGILPASEMDKPVYKMIVDSYYNTSGYTSFNWNSWPYKYGYDDIWNNYLNTSSFNIDFSDGTKGSALNASTGLTESAGTTLAGAPAINYNAISDSDTVDSYSYRTYLEKILNLNSSQSIGYLDGKTLAEIGNLSDFDDWGAISSRFNNKYDGYMAGMALKPHFVKSVFSSSMTKEGEVHLSVACPPLPTRK